MSAPKEPTAFEITAALETFTQRSGPFTDDERRFMAWALREYDRRYRHIEEDSRVGSHIRMADELLLSSYHCAVCGNITHRQNGLPDKCIGCDRQLPAPPSAHVQRSTGEHDG